MRFQSISKVGALPGRTGSHHRFCAMFKCQLSQTMNVWNVMIKLAWFNQNDNSTTTFSVPASLLAEKIRK